MTSGVVVTKVTQDLQHIDKNDLLPSANLPPIVPESAMPSPEFIETVERIEKAKKQKEATTGHPTTPQGHPEPVLPPVERKEELPVLEYRYKGNCPSCHTGLDTLMISVETTLMAIAWCSACKASILQRKVKPLGKEVTAHGNSSASSRSTVPKAVRQVQKAQKASIQGKP